MKRYIVKDGKVEEEVGQDGGWVYGDAGVARGTPEMDEEDVVVMKKERGRATTHAEAMSALLEHAGNPKDFIVDMAPNGEADITVSGRLWSDKYLLRKGAKRVPATLPKFE